MATRRIPAIDFESHAPVEVGTQTHINHTACVEGVDTRKRLYVKRVADGIVAFCHNCGLSGFIPTKGGIKRLTIKEIKQALEHGTIDRGGILTPYPGAVWDPTSWPAKARAWLYKYYFTDGMIKAAGFYYSPEMDRVVLTGRNILGVDCVSQARYLGTDTTQPKYLTRKTEHYKGFTMLHPSIVYGPFIYLCEDMLSAVRIQREGASSMCLLGTHLSTEAKTELISMNKPVCVWMDDDIPGRKAATTIIAELKQFSIHSVNYINRQPKEISPTNLGALLRTGTV